jgi:hypothetical protein
VKRFFFLLNAAFAMAILDLISHAHLAIFVIVLPKYVKYSTLPNVCRLELTLDGEIL